MNQLEVRIMGQGYVLRCPDGGEAQKIPSCIALRHSTLAYCRRTTWRSPKSKCHHSLLMPWKPAARIAARNQPR